MEWAGAAAVVFGALVVLWRRGRLHRGRRFRLTVIVERDHDDTADPPVAR